MPAARSFDHLIGAGENGGSNGEIQVVRCSEVSRRLRACHQRPRDRRAAGERDETAPPHSLPLERKAIGLCENVVFDLKTRRRATSLAGREVRMRAAGAMARRMMT